MNGQDEGRETGCVGCRKEKLSSDGEPFRTFIGNKQPAAACVPEVRHPWTEACVTISGALGVLDFDKVGTEVLGQDLFRTQNGAKHPLEGCKLERASHCL